VAARGVEASAVGAPNAEASSAKGNRKDRFFITATSQRTTWLQQACACHRWWRLLLNDHPEMGFYTPFGGGLFSRGHPNDISSLVCSDSALRRIPQPQEVVVGATASRRDKARPIFPSPDAFLLRYEFRGDMKKSIHKIEGYL
jgi:hypothetical protein